MKRKLWTLTPWFLIFGLVMLLMATFISTYNTGLFYLELGITVSAIGAVIMLSLRFRNYVRSTVRSTVEHFTGFDADYFEKYPYPVAVTGPNGDIVWTNKLFFQAFGDGKGCEGDDINGYLPGYSILDITDRAGVDISLNQKEYTVYVISNSDGSAVCHFIEDTEYKQAARALYANMPAVALIRFDNAEDFYTDSDESYSNVLISVEANIQGWATDFNGLYKRLGSNQYMIIFRDADIEKMIEQKFPVLKNVRSVSANRHIATISVGLCRGEKLVRDSEMSARKALEMALGRGGDQVAIIRDGNYEFYGGTAAATEKVSKVRMRVIANAISRAVNDADKVYIMGHRFSDLDCVGAAIGMQCVMERSFKRYSKIVINKTTSMAQMLIDYADERMESNIFITPEEALKGVTSKSLLIIVDTHLKTSLESIELYERCKRVVVIYHHRRAVNFIDNALVFCHEPSASSACEMCCEIISYLDDRALGYIQADAMLAGIMLDTKNFVMKTGVRTFEAAAYLRRKGANTLTVKEMFSGSIETYREKVDIVCRSQIQNGCAVSTSERTDGDVRLAAAQAADEMLSLTGVSASFVIFPDKDHINISARSYGRINVQVIMEKLGGGGHQTMAATQLYHTTLEQAQQQLQAAIHEALQDNPQE